MLYCRRCDQSEDAETRWRLALRAVPSADGSQAVDLYKHRRCGTFVFVASGSILAAVG